MKPAHRHPFSRLPRLGLLAAAISAASASGQQTNRVSFEDGEPDFRTDGCDVSDDGQQVVYASRSNKLADHFRVEQYDRTTGITTRIITSPSLELGRPAISGDGSTVAYFSLMPWVAGDTNLLRDVYAYSHASATTFLASARDGTADTAGNGTSERPRLSLDGDVIVFDSNATNLTTDTLGASYNVFARTTSAGTTRLVSSDASGVAGNSTSLDAAISDDGRWVAFWSIATNLVAGDTNARADVFVKDLNNGGIVLVSRSSSGALGDGTSLQPSISADGRYVAFTSLSTNLGGGTTVVSRAYRHDRDADGNGIFDESGGVSTELASIDASGNDAGENCYAARISDDGQRVLFGGFSAGDHKLNQNASSKTEIFLRDFTDGTLRNVHVDSQGNHATLGVLVDSTQFLSLSGDGWTPAYQTFADLDPAFSDNRNALDVYAHAIAEDPSHWAGYDKEGTNGFFPEFTVVGGTGTGELADFRLRRAAATSPALAFVGLANNPTYVGGFGGTLVSLPAVLIASVSTDVSGSFTAAVSGGGGPLDVWVQFAILDPGAAVKPWAISNALRVTIDP